MRLERKLCSPLPTLLNELIRGAGYRASDQPGTGSFPAIRCSSSGGPDRRDRETAHRTDEAAALPGCSRNEQKFLLFCQFRLESC
jgi:hypothetical protein